jgi:LPXTG-site transpeptidase (sortase) family protein
MNTYTHQKNTGIVSDFVHMCKTHPVLVGSLWFGVFTVLFGISLSLGIVPKIERDESPTVFAEMQKPLPKQEEKVTELKSALPERVIVERLGIDTVVVNPLSSDIATLDAALLQGVVRHPLSGDLNDESNMFLFGHSTGFRVVQNEAFKAFNGLRNAKKGDLIRVQSSTDEYVYRVTNVTLVDAQESLVSFATGKKKLTLTTCNSFGAKEERYVVEADFIGSYAL